MENVFVKNKQALVDAWIRDIFALYPFETVGFMRTQKDQFANPTGHATALACEKLYDIIAGTADVEDAHLRTALAELMRIRAVQEDDPARAVAALFLIKPLMRKKMLTEALTCGALDAYLDAESRVDSLVLLAFNMYNADKETVFSTRISEIKRRYVQMERWVVRHGGMVAFDDTTDSMTPVTDSSVK